MFNSLIWYCRDWRIRATLAPQGRRYDNFTIVDCIAVLLACPFSRKEQPAMRVQALQDGEA